MNDLKKIFFALTLSVGLTPLYAQEPWDVHFKFTAGMMNNAEENVIGQNKVYGLAIAGAYPLSIHGTGILEGGYKVFPTTTSNYGITVVDDQSDLYFAGVMYRYELWRNGIYLQGGIRASNTRTIRDMIYKGTGENGKDNKEKLKGDRQTKTGWSFAVGYRLTDLWSLEFGASSASFKNVDALAVSGTIFDIALCVHR
jgi:hypothetical protein